MNTETPDSAPGQPLLRGVRIIDLSRVLAGPYCTQLLGDLGADVIKIEQPGRGDDTRQWGPPYTASGEAAYFLSANRNKRSLTLNLKHARGLEILRALIGHGDVLVENFKAGTLEEWGLDYAALQQLRPGLICCSITGYGQTGPYASRPGYDFIAQAMSGFMSVTGAPDGEPQRAGVAIADLAAGLFASNAILAALVARASGGGGQRIDIALLDSQIALLSYVMSNFLVSGKLPQRQGNAHPNIVPYQEFKARDIYFAFAAGNDLQWQKFCAAAGRAAWATDARFATNPARVQHRAEVGRMLSELFATRDAAEWIALCEQAGIPAGPINTLERVFADPQVQARGMRVDVAHALDGSVPLVGSPLKIPTAPVQMRHAPPPLGHHTQEILGELLGYNAEQVAELRAAGVV